MPFDRDVHREAHEPMRLRVYRTILDSLAGLTSLDGKTILDVGCSYGWFIVIAGERGMIATGIEADPNHVKIARSSGLDVFRGLFPDGSLGSRRFDFLIFNDVFEHISDVQQAMDACRAHLNPNGMLILNLPSAEGAFFFIARALDRLGYRRPLERVWQKPFPSPHLHYFLPTNLVRLAARHGFDEIYRSWVPTVDNENLWSRIRVDSSVSAAQAAMVWTGLKLVLPVINLLPPDTRLAIFRKSSTQP